MRRAAWERQDADREQRHRIHSLKNSDEPVHHELAGILSTCTSQARCLNGACAICGRHFSLVLRVQIEGYYQQWEHVATTTFGTLFREEWLVKPGRLHEIRIDQLKAMLGRQFERQFDTCLVMGVVEIVWRPEFRRYLVHVHFILVGAPPEAVSPSFERTYPNFEQEIRDPLILAHRKFREDPLWKLRPRQMDYIYDAGGLGGYLTKFSTAMKEKYVGEGGKLKTRPDLKRPPVHIQNELLEFLGRYRHRDFMFWRHVKLSPTGRLFMPARSWDAVCSNFYR